MCKKREKKPKRTSGGRWVSLVWSQSLISFSPFFRQYTVDKNYKAALHYGLRAVQLDPEDERLVGFVRMLKKKAQL